LLYLLFSFPCSAAHRALHSFPTRRSSDLGSFAREWIAECRNGAPKFNELRRNAQQHQIEQVGAQLRAMMPWTEEGKAAQAGRTRSEEHTSELQSPYDLVCRLLLEKKKQKK